MVSEQQVNPAGREKTMNCRIMVELLMLILQIILFVMNFTR